MPVWSSLPIEVHTPRLFWPFPLVSQVFIQWEFSVDATKSEPLTGPDTGTKTTTVTGSGSGSVTVICGTRRYASGDPTDVGPNSFLVTRRLSAQHNHAVQSKNFRLWLPMATEAGTYSIETSVHSDYDDSSLTDTDDTTTDADNAVVIPLIMSIGKTTVSVDQFAVGSQTSEFPLSFWIPTDTWTFSRSALWTPQTFATSKSAEDLGFDSGDGLQKSVTITLSPWQL